MQIWIALAGLNGFIGVAVGALAAHALQSRLPPADLELVELASRYQLLHALALFGVGWLEQMRPGLPVHVAGWAFLLGILLFCGSLYAIAFSGSRSFAVAAPVGGVLLLAGWIAVAVAGFRQ